MYWWETRDGRLGIREWGLETGEQLHCTFPVSNLWSPISSLRLLGLHPAPPAPTLPAFCINLGTMNLGWPHRRNANFHKSSALPTMSWAVIPFYPALTFLLIGVAAAGVVPGQGAPLFAHRENFRSSPTFEPGCRIRLQQSSSLLLRDSSIALKQPADRNIAPLVAAASERK